VPGFAKLRPHPATHTPLDQELLHPHDAELVRRALSGHRKAIVELVERMGCVPRILASRNARMGSPVRDHDLPDLVQDTLLVIWRKLPTFEGRSSLETWIYRICCLELMNFVRRKRRTGREQGREEELLELGAPTTSLSNSQEYEDLYQAMERLPASELEIVRLKHFDDLTFESVGGRLGISENTAKTRYYRGLKRLNGFLGATRGQEVQR